MVNALRAATLRVTRDELTWLLSERLRALQDATALSNGGRPLPLRSRWGWRANLELYGRQRDGTLSAAVRVWTPDRRSRYTRRLRCIQRRPSRSTSELVLTQRA